MNQKSKKNIFFVDGLAGRIKHPKFFDFFLYEFVRKNKNKSVLFSKKGRTGSFFTRDSKLYLTPDEYRRSLRGERIIRITRRVDSLNSSIFGKTRIYSIGQKDIAYLQIRRRYSSLANYISDLVRGSVQGVSAARMWNISIVGSVIFGMLTMTMIYRYLGESVSAKIEESKMASEQIAEVYSKMEDKDLGEDIDPEFMTKLLSDYEKFEKEDEAQRAMKKEIEKMVKGYPIEKMVPEIAKKDKIVAALLVAIAMKESTWGKHVPVLNGKDCYNYWGYRGIRDKMGTGGHTCFDSPEDAVNTVAKRIEFLVSNEKLNTPAKMVVWKCGYDCSWDNKKAVKKWISDVDLYFRKLNK